jgi:hypothetical protein
MTPKRLGREGHRNLRQAVPRLHGSFHVRSKLRSRLERRRFVLFSHSSIPTRLTRTLRLDALNAYRLNKSDGGKNVIPQRDTIYPPQTTDFAKVGLPQSLTIIGAGGEKIAKGLATILKVSLALSRAVEFEAKTKTYYAGTRNRNRRQKSKMSISDDVRGTDRLLSRSNPLTS